MIREDGDAAAFGKPARPVPDGHHLQAPVWLQLLDHGAYGVQVRDDGAPGVLFLSSDGCTDAAAAREPAGQAQLFELTDAVADDVVGVSAGTWDLEQGLERRLQVI